jgi:hypothetical protein
MDQGSGDRDWFRVGASVPVSVTIIWVKLLAFLRFMLIDFADVFTSCAVARPF